MGKSFYLILLIIQYYINMDYLDFEKPIEELENKLKKALELGKDDSVNIKQFLTLKAKLRKKKRYIKFIIWQKVQLSNTL